MPTLRLASRPISTPIAVAIAIAATMLRHGFQSRWSPFDCPLVTRFPSTSPAIP